MEFLREGMRRAAARARIWSYAWASTYAALTVGQLVAIPAVSHHDRPDYYIGAGGSAIGVIAIAAFPLSVMHDQRRLEARLSLRSPVDNPCVDLAVAEAYLLRDAKAEELGRGPIAHAGNVLLNLGIGLALVLGFHHYEAGAISAAAGIAIGEVQIFTQPTSSISLLQRYRAADLGPMSRSAATGLHLSLRPFAGSNDYGLMLLGVY